MNSDKEQFDKDSKKTPLYKFPKGSMVGLFIAWAIVFLLIVTLVLVAVFVDEFKPSLATWISIVIAFSSFVATSFFSISIYNHNKTIRESNVLVRTQSEESARRSEAFRNMQFASSNYTIVDFVETLEIYEEFSRYTNRLKVSEKFDFYALEKGLDKNTVLENFEDCIFLTARLPIKIVEGKAVASISFSSIRFETLDGKHRFFPVDEQQLANALILYNESQSRQELVINLITHKDSAFYTPGIVNTFTKIKFNTVMKSVLGVEVRGSIELYFTNPEKPEISGSNIYKINSSLFEVFGMPKFTSSEEFD